MTISIRSHLTSGIAVVGAGAIALSPVAPPSPDATLVGQRVSAMAVDLASSIDPFTPWVDTFQTAVANIAGLLNSFAARPFPIAQQVLQNQITYLGELPDVGLILEQAVNNVGNAIGAPAVESPGNINPADSGEFLSAPLDHWFFYQVTVGPARLPILTDEQVAQIKPIFDLLTMPITGIALGLLGPFVSPVLAVVESVGAIVEALGESDFIGAINEVINIPANVVNAVLNGGQFLDLAGLLGIELPDIITRFGLTTGGLLSQGAWQDPDRDPIFGPSSGPGVAFDALSITAEVEAFSATAVLNGLPLGPIGTLIGLTGSVADAIAVTPPTPPAETPSAAAAAAPEDAAPAADDALADLPPTLEPVVEEPLARPVAEDPVTGDALDEVMADIETVAGEEDAGATGTRPAHGEDAGSRADTAGDEGGAATEAGAQDSETDAA